MKCDVKGCDRPALEAYGLKVCVPHGMAINAALASQGLEFETWQARCQAAAKWLQKACQGPQNRFLEGITNQPGTGT